MSTCLLLSFLLLICFSNNVFVMASPASHLEWETKQPDGSSIPVLLSRQGPILVDPRDKHPLVRNETGWLERVDVKAVAKTMMIQTTTNTADTTTTTTATTNQTTSPSQRIRAMREAATRHYYHRRRFLDEADDEEVAVASSLQPVTDEHSYTNDMMCDGFHRSYWCPNNPVDISQMGRADLSRTTGTLNMVVLLVRFSDHVNRTMRNASDYQRFFDEENLNDPEIGPTGSVRDYFRRQSYGQFELRSFVQDWIDIDMTEEEASFDRNGRTRRFGTFVARQGLDRMDAEGTNWTMFDGDGDGEIDAVFIIHSGFNAETGGDDCISGRPWGSHRIWAHRGNSQPAFSQNFRSSDRSVIMGNYATASAWYRNCGPDMVRLGVVAHEIGHMWNLPDNNGPVGWGTGIFDLMGHYFGTLGQQYFPASLNAWCKQELGWVTPLVLEESGNYSLAPYHSSGDVILIDAGFANDEYLLLENRLRRSDDLELPNDGLLIWHISLEALNPDEDWNARAGYPGMPGWPSNGMHYQVALLQADGAYELERELNPGDSNDYYYGFKSIGPGPNELVAENKTDPTLYPNTDSYALGTIKQTGIRIFNIRLDADNILQFDLEIPTDADAPTASPSVEVGEIPLPPIAAPSPTPAPTASTTASPTGGPTAPPTASPTAGPTASPTASPTKGPTASPTSSPTAGPTTSPTTSPTAGPTASPTASPTAGPTTSPTTSPTASPTASPTTSPTAGPTASPTTSPTAGPTSRPTQSPSTSPSLEPTGVPSSPPSFNPTSQPTKRPSLPPTPAPQITGIVLIDADTNEAEGFLDDGTTIDLRLINSTSLTVVAETSGTIGSVLWNIDTNSLSETINVAPWKLTDGSALTTIGTHVISARPYEFSDLGGRDDGATFTVTVTVIETTLDPTASPTTSPTSSPTASPTTSPTSGPTASPTTSPTSAPTTLAPTGGPTQVPSVSPSGVPSVEPSMAPSSLPSLPVTASPTGGPTGIPSGSPSGLPSLEPSHIPSDVPSSAPSSVPSSIPSGTPSGTPSANPTSSPTASSPTMATSLRPTLASDAVEGVLLINPTTGDVIMLLATEGMNLVDISMVGMDLAIEVRYPAEVTVGSVLFNFDGSFGGFSNELPFRMVDNPGLVALGGHNLLITPHTTPSLTGPIPDYTWFVDFTVVDGTIAPSPSPTRDVVEVPPGDDDSVMSSPDRLFPTQSVAPSEGPTVSAAPTVSAEPTSPTAVPSAVPSTGSPSVSRPPVDASWSPSISTEPSVTPSSEPSLSVEPSLSPSSEPSASVSPSALPSFGPSESLLPSAVPTNVATDPPSLVPSETPTESALPSSSPSGGPTSTVLPSSEPSEAPSVSDMPSLSPSGEPTTTDEPSSVPSEGPTTTFEPSQLPSEVPSDSLEPSSGPTTLRSEMPSSFPSDEPSSSLEPSAFPSEEPTLSAEPSSLPSVAPTSSSFPSAMPSAEATRSMEPSDLPSQEPSWTFEPSSSPSSGPSQSIMPSGLPSEVPTMSDAPSGLPSEGPTTSALPSTMPSDVATLSVEPSSYPSGEPSWSNVPSTLPSEEPTASMEPSSFPSSEPSLSNVPSTMPSEEPTESAFPSSEPSVAETLSMEPSSYPSGEPSLSTIPSTLPSEEPTESAFPSSEPSAAATLSMEPSSYPSGEPSWSNVPSTLPSEEPTESAFPSSEPSAAATLSMEPSSYPSGEPSWSNVPSTLPSEEPTESAFPSSEPSAAPTLSMEPSSYPSDEPSLSNVPSALPSVPSIPRTTTSRPSAEPINLVNPIPDSDPTFAPITNRPSSSVYPPTSSISVESFWIVDADTDLDVRELTMNDVLDIQQLPLKWTLVARTEPPEVGSVAFELDGEEVKRESFAPYTISKDMNGDFAEWDTWTFGSHWLTGVPYTKGVGSSPEGVVHRVFFRIVNGTSEPSMAPSLGPSMAPSLEPSSLPSRAPVADTFDGSEGPSFTPSATTIAGSSAPSITPSAGATFPTFSPINSLSSPGPTRLTPPPTSDIRVASFMLVDADLNVDIAQLVDGYVLDLAVTPGNWSIVAITEPAVVGDVRMELDFNENFFRVEERPPYALTGDMEGNFFSVGMPVIGNHTMKATPYTDKYLLSPQGFALQVQFSIIDSSDTNNPATSAPTASTGCCTMFFDECLSSSDPLFTECGTDESCGVTERCSNLSWLTDGPPVDGSTCRRRHQSGCDRVEPFKCCPGLACISGYWGRTCMTLSDYDYLLLREGYDPASIDVFDINGLEPFGS